MNFIFSEEDKEIIGSMRYVDPLGIQPVWHFYARRIIPNLTEQTNTIHGFVLFIYVMNLYNDFINNKKKNEVEIGLIPFFLIIEKLLGISICKEDKDKWKLRGIEGIERFLNNFLNNNETIITQDTSILQNQKANGTWGLFRGAAIRSNIIVEPNDQNIPQPDFNNIEITDKDRILDFLRKKIHVKEREITYSISVNECDELKKSFLNLLDIQSNLEFLKKVFNYILKNPQNPHDCNTNFMLELPPKEEGIQTIKEYFATLGKDSKDYERIIDIIKIENYLSYLNNCFYYLLNNIDNQTDGLLKFNVDEISKLFEFKESINLNITKNSSAGTRLEIYNKHLNNPQCTNEKFIEALIKIHKDVAESRHKDPWIEMENNKLKLKISRSSNVNKELQENWVNSYYINSLMNIRKERKEYGIQ